MSGHNRTLGAAGEAATAEWYETRGYQVLARNWRCREGELDLVLAQGRTVVFCEVKTRSSAAFGAPMEAVTRPKQQRIRRLAARWLEATGARPADLRFDVASVLAGQVTVLEACF